MKKFAFTLAEIMIVLSVIAILTAILLPTARNAMPNENIMKFKKGHNMFYNTISELVNSDKYYLDGDLGTKADGTLLYEWNTKPEQQRYFCESFADVLPTKFLECPIKDFYSAYLYLWDCTETDYATKYYNCNGSEVSPETIQRKKTSLDNACKTKPFTYGVPTKQFIAQNNIWYYDISPMVQFGTTATGAVLGWSGDDASKTYTNIFPTFSSCANFL